MESCLTQTTVELIARFWVCWFIESKFGIQEDRV